ncbi:hypothetical protein ABID52_003203 [Fictibacillus halophilus]|uniref:Holin-like toxin n=1 Tax=Fictibacillus halophilus TaxID=1610490 RepID=A0ABV2LPX3_9BACL|nr:MULTISPECIES: putative holin-like toxin [Fictibacillus]
MGMTVFEAMSLMIGFSMLVLTIIRSKDNS